MPNIGIIYYADGVKNLYRNNVELTTPVWGGQSSFQILKKRLANINISGSVLLIPDDLLNSFTQIASESNTEIISYNTSDILEKPYALNQQHWGIENSSGNDSWYGAAFAKVFEKYNWKTAVLIPLTNLLIDPSDVKESLDLYFREGFEVCIAEERVPGAEWAIFDRDLIVGLYRSNPEVMTTRGALYWAIKKPLYPFKVGAFHCPRIRPLINANLRINSQRALYSIKAVASDGFDSPDFSYGDFINNSGWEKAYVDYAPLQIYVEPSSFCNAFCDGCPNKNLKREKSFLSVDEFADSVSDIQDKDQRIIFSGAGEPLLNNDINDIINVTNNFCSVLHTSLQVLPDKNFPYEALDHIRVSVDADISKGFARVRPGCNWQNIEVFIEKYNELKESYSIKIPELGLDFLRRGISEADILPFMKKWRNVCKPVFNGEFFRWPFDEKPSKISWYQISGQASYCGLSCNTSTVDFEPAKRRPCRNAFGLSILSDGTVTACPFDVEGSNFKLGNIKNSTLMQIWKSEEAASWRQSQLTKQFQLNSYCINCHDWYKNL